MKQFSIITLLLLCIACSSQKKRKIIGNSDFQRELNAEYKDASTSPLTKKDLKTFKGLPFFPINNTFKVKAKLTKTPNAGTTKFATTTDRVAEYDNYGIIEFSINKQNFSLKIYKDSYPKEIYKDYLFLPYFDKTNGNSTYKGGRFVDVFTTDEQEDGTILIDFNKSYNPYCAYNDKYSCPITPRDNYLAIEVTAGVKKHNKKDHQN